MVFYDGITKEQRKRQEDLDRAFEKMRIERGMRMMRYGLENTRPEFRAKIEMEGESVRIPEDYVKGPAGILKTLCIGGENYVLDASKKGENSAVFYRKART